MNPLSQETRVVKFVSLALVAALTVAAAGCERAAGILLPPQEAATATPQERSPLFSTTATCTPGGFSTGFGPTLWTYEHTANGEFDQNACWSPVRATHTSSPTCGGILGWSDAGYQFGYLGSLRQTIVVPSDFHAIQWDLDYFIDFIDPNDDGRYNTLSVTIRDLTANRTLASDRYTGASPNISCKRRPVSFTGDLAGHTLSIRIDGSTPYSNTTIRVLSASLWQSGVPAGS